MTKLRHIATPTTFVYADSGSFRELVQKLTGGSSDTEEDYQYESSEDLQNGGYKMSSASNNLGFHMSPRRPSFKLHDRRNMSKKLELQNSLSTCKPELLSLGLPDLVSSPTSPVRKLCSDSVSASEEGSFISRGGLFSQLSLSEASPSHSQPKLLPLFPVRSAQEGKLS